VKHTYTYVCVCVCVCVYIYIYIHIYTQFFHISGFSPFSSLVWLLGNHSSCIKEAISVMTAANNRVAQMSVNCSVNCILKYLRNSILLINIRKLLKTKFYMFNEQLTALWYRTINWLAGLNWNIPIASWGCIRLTDFWASL
jgi:hypothetical protein